MAHDFERHVHSHDFLPADHDRNSRRVWLVVALTGVTMVAEIVAGTLFGSMALLADGWHMGTHLVALAVSGLAYWTARRYADDPRFAFGTGKVGDLVAFASAIGLGLTALLIASEAVERLAEPQPIAFTEARRLGFLAAQVDERAYGGSPRRRREFVDARCARGTLCKPLLLSIQGEHR